MSSDLNDKAVGTAREELQEAHIRIESLAYQLSALQKQVHTHVLTITQRHNIPTSRVEENEV